MNRFDLLQLYLRLGLTPIPLKPRSKEALVRWGDGWNPTPEELARWAALEAAQTAVRSTPEFHGYYQRFRIRKGTNAAKVATARRKRL